MTRTYLLFALSFLLLSSTVTAQKVNGKVKSTGDADLHVIRLYADSFPKVSLTFQAETKTGSPVWNLEQKDVRVEENDRQGTITSFRLLSAEKHLETMLVIDHSGSMQYDWRYWTWYAHINWDSIPYTDTVRSYLKPKYAIAPSTHNSKYGYGEVSEYSGPYEIRDTFYVAKRAPLIPNYHSPLWYAQQGAKVFLKSMSREDSTGLIGFSDIPDLDIPSARNNASTISQIDNMTAQGATAFFDAVDQSLNHLVYHRGLRAIVALTDGGDNSSITTLERVIEKANKMHCPVYVIGLGNVDEEALKKMTSETGGELFLTNDATKLTEVFLKISKKLQSVYEVVYESPFLKSSDSTHELQLRFDVDSMFLKSQLVDLPLPENVIVHLQQREAQQNSFQQNFPISNEDTITSSTSSISEPLAISNIDPPQPAEFPYGMLGVTFLAAGAGALIYRKTQRKTKHAVLKLVNVFPNPTADPVTVNYFADAEIAAIRLVVTNDSGNEVFTQALSSSEQSVGINLESLASGMYFIRLESNNGMSATNRVIVQR